MGIFVYDERLRITECNERFGEILGSGREALIGLDMTRLKDGRILPTLRAPLEGREGSYEGLYHATLSTVGHLRLHAHRPVPRRGRERSAAESESSRTSPRRKQNRGGTADLRLARRPQHRPDRDRLLGRGGLLPEPGRPGARRHGPARRGKEAGGRRIRAGKGSRGAARNAGVAPQDGRMERRDRHTSHEDGDCRSPSRCMPSSSRTRKAASRSPSPPSAATSRSGRRWKRRWRGPRSWIRSGSWRGASPTTSTTS